MLVTGQAADVPHASPHYCITHLLSSCVFTSVICVSIEFFSSARESHIFVLDMYTKWMMR